jgi:hypothetical protein
VRYSFSTLGNILITAVCIFLSILILTWVSGVSSPPAIHEISVQVSRLNQTHVSVMLFSVQHQDTVIRRLSYNTSGATGFINRTDSPFDFVKDVGDYGIIQLAGNNEYLEITAVLENTTNIVYIGKI